MRYFLIAGEASGDLHASNLMVGLKDVDPEAEFMFVGGDLMAEVACQKPFQHYREINFMGLFAVIAHMRSLRRILLNTKKAIIDYAPDALILVDYAGFNLRIARAVAGKGIRIFYYISPKVWAWRKSRIRLLKKYVDRLFVIFPFEVEFFRQNGMEVDYQGNPLLDVMQAFKQKRVSREQFLASNNLPDRPVIALLAGSRKQEITNCLPEMIRASQSFPDHNFVVAGAPSVDKYIYESLLEGTGISIVYDKTYHLLSHALAAVVTSGTATLETALLDVPQVVIYKTGKLTYNIGKIFVNFRFFSLVNLIFGDELVKELLQHGVEEGIRDELNRIINEPEYSLKIRAGYARIRHLMGAAGTSRRIAGKMTELLQKREPLAHERSE
ncbi:MAG: lipid-A-disaccharide synthase [Bacteroidales bacterium]